jgi:hypothetical protein
MSDEKKQQPEDLFHNQMVDSAMKALTPEQLEDYEKWGKYLFKTDFAGTNGPNPEKEMKDAIFYIKEGLKSGVHPEDLAEKELQIMYDIYGDKWYEEYGYFQDEVPPKPGLESALGNIANAMASDHLTPEQIQQAMANKAREDAKKEKKRRKKRRGRTNKHK